MADLDDILGDISRKRYVPTDHPPKKKAVSQSQEFRFILHAEWQLTAAASMPFENYYQREMLKLIEERRAKLNNL